MAEFYQGNKQDASRVFPYLSSLYRGRGVFQAFFLLAKCGKLVVILWITVLCDLTLIERDCKHLPLKEQYSL